LPFFSKAQIVGGNKELPEVRKPGTQISKKNQGTAVGNGKKSLPVAKNTPPAITLSIKSYELSILDNELSINWSSFDKEGDNLTAIINSKNYINNTYPDIKINGNDQAVISKLTKAGLYKFELFVKDNKGNSSNREEFIVTVNNPPLPDIRIEGTSTKIIAKGNVKLSVKNLNQNNRLKYRWGQQDGNRLYIENNTGESVNVSYLQPGDYSVYVVATDIIGRESKAYYYFQVMPEKKIISPPNITSSIKGGPKNAILNLLIPGLGHYYVSGNCKGENRKKSFYVVTSSYFGVIGGAAFCKIISNSEYKLYKKNANKLEYIYDLNGSIIGIRAANQSNADQYYKSANSYNKIYKSLVLTAGGILVTDFIFTLYKGFKNQNNFNQINFNKVKFGFNYNTLNSSIETTAQVSF